MTDDCYGHDTGLSDTVALRHWNDMMRAFLAHGASTPDHLASLLDRAPDFAMGHAVKGLFLLLLGRAELVPAARDALQAARARREGAVPRARHYTDALGHWLDGYPVRSVESLEAILRQAPDEPLAMKLGHAVRFVLGDAAGMRRSLERVLPAYAADHPARGYLLGCHAFALEETGAYAAAEIAGRQALWLAPDDAWGLHAVAHVHDMTGNAEAGLDWLRGREDAWAHCNNFRFHVWWHKALLLLDLGHVEEALDLYDTRVRAERTDDYRDISNAASLLMRLELEGVDVGARWEELAAFSAARTEDACLIFADLHYLLSLLGAGRAGAAETLIARIRRTARDDTGDFGVRAADPGQETAQGLRAFSDANYDRAFHHLLAARPSMQRAGGSHAQRDVFERITIDAGLRAGRIDRVEQLLADRRSRRGGHEDGYCARRRSLIDTARRSDANLPIPAQ